MIDDRALEDARQICARYGVTLEKAQGKSKHWKPEQARAEIAHALKIKHKAKLNEISVFLGRKPADTAILIKRIELVHAAFQKQADTQHQAFLNSDEAAHIRAELETAQAAIGALQEENASLKRESAWKDGRRADGVRRADGFTETETGVLRILASRAFISNTHSDAVYRHMSNIRKKLKAYNLDQTVKIKTIIGDGYELESGQGYLNNLLMGGRRALSNGREQMQLVAA